VTAQHFHTVVDAVVSIDDQVAALTDLSTMEFNATTTAFGADLPGQDAKPWISLHRVSSNSMARSLPEPPSRHHSRTPRAPPDFVATHRRDRNRRELASGSEPADGG
jgi:hypothetical protein